MRGYIGGSGEGYPSWDGSLGSYTSIGFDLSDLHRATEDLLERALADVADVAGHVEIERRVVQGAAAEILVKAATLGDLLVVGSRGHGGFAGLLLGSVSQQCVHHAACPVVIVHPPKPTATAPSSVPRHKPKALSRSNAAEQENDECEPSANASGEVTAGGT
jgi:hypothetical protein